MKKKLPREYWIALPPADYEGPPAAWTFKETAERCSFPVRDQTELSGVRLFKPVEVVHVIENLAAKTKKK